MALTPVDLPSRSVLLVFSGAYIKVLGSAIDGFGELGAGTNNTLF